MSEKRRDQRNRILATGESQRKLDGRYCYKYTENGKVKFIYSWKLTPLDSTPKGKRDDLSLREKIKEIQQNQYDGINTSGAKMTLCQLYEKQNVSRANVKRSTVTNRKSLKELLKNDPLGSRSIDSIKPSDAKAWALRMKENGYSFNTINNAKRSLVASFYIAIEDDYVRKNPFIFKLDDVIQDDSKAKYALTEDQENEILSFVKADKTYQQYYDAIVILLNTGLRISELCGLTINDIDFQSRLINVDHQLMRNKEVGYYINTPKTKSGIRQIPMSETVYKTFQSVIANRKNAKRINIDGYSDFLFLNKKGYPLIGAYYTVTLTNLVRKYNKTNKDHLPKITPHILRHTFCTRLAEKNMNPKSLQYLMGHSSINITMNLYAHASLEGIKAEMTRLCA